MAEDFQTTCDTTCADDALCVGDVVEDEAWHAVCRPEDDALEATATGRLRRSGAERDAAAVDGRITVVANYMVGCNAGRREAGLFAHFAQIHADTLGEGRVLFLSSLKGEAACDKWAEVYESDARTAFGVEITDQPRVRRAESFL